MYHVGAQVQSLLGTETGERSLEVQQGVMLLNHQPDFPDGITAWSFGRDASKDE